MNIKIILFLLLSYKLSYSQCLFPYYDNYKVGYKSINNDIIIYPKFFGGSEFNNGYAIVENYNYKKGVINCDGKFVLDTLYNDVIINSDSTFWVSDNGLFGLLNGKNDWLLNPQFNEVKVHTNLISPIRIGEFWGLYDIANRKFITELKFEYIWDASQGYFLAKEKGLFYFLDLNGINIFFKTFSSAKPFSNEGIADVLINKTWFKFNLKTNKLTEGNFKYEHEEKK